jgi:ubiquinone/menaquinone biosynthesis C-methylase UbiE
MKPQLELYGLDVSSWAIEIAKRYLDPVIFDLRVSSIERTPYPDAYFDIVTCASSMSYWENLVACFNEIHRILKPGGSAHLFEPQDLIDINEVDRTIRDNMQGKGWLRTNLAVAINRFALQRGSRIGLRLYSTSEIEGVVSQSMFNDHVTVERVTLQNLPIFMCVILRKVYE